MNCKKPDGTFTTTTWAFFYAQCTPIQQALGLCSANAGAWVPAITICTQRLYS